MTESLPTVTEFTPDELAAIHAELNARFTADDLYGYVEDNDVRIPAAEVFARFSSELRASAAKRDAGEP